MKSWHSKVALRKIKIGYLIVGVILGITLMNTTNSICKLREEEKELIVLKQEQSTSKEAVKIKKYIQSKNPKIWDSLALDMANSYLSKSKKYNVSVDLLVGKDWVESNFNIFARSNAGAKGLGQLNDSAWKDVLPKGNPYEPSYNIDSCAKVMSFYTTKYGLNKGLELYNVGEGNYKKGVRNPLYVTKVLSSAYEFKTTTKGY